MWRRIKYKKQSGGRGQYGGCWIRFEPLAGSHGFEFEWASSVEKGLIGAMQHGVLSGVGPSA